MSPRHTSRPTVAPDSGLTLIEVMVALFMLAAVSAVAAGFFVGAVRTTEELSDKQNATALATRALEAVQSVPVSQVLSGRTPSAVQALLATPRMAPLVAQDDLSSTAEDPSNFDPSATAASVPVVPLMRTETIEGTTYDIRTAVNRCWLSTTGMTQRACTGTAVPAAVPVLRATVDLRWGDAGCGSRCSYSTSALLDRQADPVFPVATS